MKWHLPSSTSAEHRGHTPKALIRDHKVHWSYHRNLPVRLTIDKHNVLCDSWVEFEVLQEYTSRERIFLGRVSVNIAEFVDQDDGGNGEQMADNSPPPAATAGEGTAEDKREGETTGVGTSRRYLMQDSKINSTLKIGIRLRQTEGPTDYTAPILKTANTFGGIAGIHVGVGAGIGGSSNAEQASGGGADGGEDGSTMPSMSSKAQESGKTQDMYRQNLAASWAAQAGELPPDQCIEDIFAGGDGWADKGAGGAKGSGFGGGGGGRGPSGSMGTDDGERTIRGHERNTSGATLKPSSQGRHHWRRHSREKQASGGSGSSSWGGTTAVPSTVSGSGTNLGTVTGRTGIDQQVQAHRRQGSGQDPDHSKWAQNVRMRELNEFEEREDLRSWEIGAPG